MNHIPFQLYVFLNDDDDDFLCMLLEPFEPDTGFARVVRFPTAEKFIARPQDLMEPPVYFSTPFGDIDTTGLDTAILIEALGMRIVDSYTKETPNDNAY